MKTPNTKLAYRAPVAALWFGVALANAQIEDPNVSYIVQGPELEAVQTAITAAGGRVTHELAVINGVAALLSDAQVSRLEAQSNLRLTPDNRLSLDSATGSEVRFSGKKLYWTLENGSASTSALQSLELDWPEDNGAVKKVKLDGETIFDEKLETPGTEISAPDWKVTAADRSLAGNAEQELTIEFEHDVDTNQFAYAMTARFSNGPSQAFVANSCTVAAEGAVKLKGKKLEWEIENTGEALITLDSLSANWPRANGELKKIKLEKEEILKDALDAPVATILDQWEGKEDDREIKGGDSAKLTLEFKDDVETDGESYALMLRFAEGCALELTAEHTDAAQEETSDFQKRKADKKARLTNFPELIGASSLHAEGVTGAGVGVAILDTGVWSSGGGKDWLATNAQDRKRVISYDAIKDKVGDYKSVDDKHGHGTHLTSIIASSRVAERSGRDDKVKANSIAPDAELVIVRAFDASGHGTYADVIRGIDWVVANQQAHNIRVLNLSFGAQPQSHYWDDPLNQAVMAAWQAGIVVGGAAGHHRPAPISIGVTGHGPNLVPGWATTDN
ncbi:MAG: S8 family serine peptidase, partial [Pseudomonadota bacterium]